MVVTLSVLHKASLYPFDDASEDRVMTEADTSLFQCNFARAQDVEKAVVDRGQDLRPRPRPRKLWFVKTEADDNRGFFLLAEAEAEAEEC